MRQQGFELPPQKTVKLNLKDIGVINWQNLLYGPWITLPQARFFILPMDLFTSSYSTNLGMYCNVLKFLRQFQSVVAMTTYTKLTELSSAYLGLVNPLGVSSITSILFVKRTQITYLRQIST